MNKILKLIFCFLLSLAFSKSYSQTVIDYSAWSTSQCNAFYPSPPTINGIVHTTTCGTVIYDNTNHAIELDTKAENNIYKGTEYKLGFNFKQGYSYTIKINAWCSTPTFPEPNSKIRVDFSSASNGSGLFCNGVESFNTTSSLTNDNNKQLTAGAYFDYTFSYNSLSVAQSYLYIGGFLPNTTETVTSWILIKKVTITEIPPSVSFTLPASTTFGCGTTTPQTFTVTNVNGTTGITNYTWNLGSASNNWLYNGSPATQTISTGTTGSISLTPVCGAVQTNVYATVTANGNTYNTNTSAVSYTPPAVTITGNSALCSGATSYQLSGVPCNSTVVWSASPTGVVTLTPNGDQVTVTKTGNGSVTLSASITVPCNSTPVVVNKNILVGLPSIDGSPAYYTDYGGPYPILLTLPFGNPPIPNEICEDHGGTTDINFVGATSILWSKTDQSPGASITWYPDSYNNLKFWIHNAGDWAAFKVTYGNECGSSNVTYKFKAVTCDPYPPHSDIVTGGQFMISPNPASGTVTISLNSKSTISKTEISKTTGIIQVSITDANGILKKQQQFSANTANMQLDVSGLIPGIYFVQIINGDVHDRQQLIINR